ncbi:MULTISPECIES: VOC family protein [Gordonia]|uniref:VOC family protein n=1 Tax=Gordonia TaxID=2053 RepID=UPI000990A68B|nr:MULTISPECIES: VOC family protein [Gordonia]MBR7192654.1 VOC family protein [Gordonia sp. SCSIO 19800]MCX2754965.1 VOC family protein [Gordonia sp. 4N]MDT0221782.1 VOC family protein [Gordonia sp. AC31]UPG68578.1 VOC family protein [Gordonia hongkongensis]
MNVTSVYPVLMSTDVAAAADFYQRVLGFEVTFSADWYVSMRTGVFELALVDATHPTIPEGHRRPAAGLLVNIEVDDVDVLYRRLTDEHGLRPVLELRDEDFGQRHFIVEGPDGVLLDCVQPIPAIGEFADAYVADASTN